MKPSKELTLSEMATMSLGDFSYDPGNPDAQAPTIPPADAPCDYDNGPMHRSKIKHVFGDLDVLRHGAQKASVSTALIRMIGDHLTRHAVARHE
jgi:hypothetical protein